MALGGGGCGGQRLGEVADVEGRGRRARLMLLGAVRVVFQPFQLFL